MPADHAKVKELFLAVLEMPAAERAAYLSTACAGDTALRQQLEVMLQSQENSGELLPRSPAELLADSGATDANATAALGLSPQGPPTSIEGGPADGAESLSFLEPSDKPGHLGRLGRYEILQVIGKGGFGIVLKGFDERLHRVVAIKALSPAYAANGSARKRFIREAQTAAAVKNEHVVGIYDVEKDAQPPYLAMELIDGISLQDKLDKHGPLSVKEILRIGVQMAEGLAAAHKQGLVHRDIKPANILLENGVERVKITDFGLARAVDDASVTQSGTVAGTPMYMSPEQAEGLQVDHRSDLFSLGTVLYAMCIGHPPFRASGTHAVLKRVIDASPRPICEINNEIPDWLCDIISKLHAKKPEDRFQSAKEVAELLGQRLSDVQAGRARQSEATRLQNPDAASPAAPMKKQSTVPFGTKIAVLITAIVGLGLVITPIVLDIRSPVGILFALTGFSICLIGLTILVMAVVATKRWLNLAGIVLMAVLLGAVVLVCQYLLRDSQPAPFRELYSISGRWESNFGAVWLEDKAATIEGYFIPEPDKKGTITEGIYDPVKGTVRLICSEPWRNGTSSTDLKLSSDGQKLEGTWTNDAGESGIWTLIRSRTNSPPRLNEEAETAGWVALFNGKDLTGWKTFGKTTANAGELLLSPHTVVETIKTMPPNFHLRMEAKLVSGQGVVRFHGRPHFDKLVEGHPDNGWFIMVMESEKKPGTIHAEMYVAVSGQKDRRYLPSIADEAKLDEWFILEIIATDKRGARHADVLINGKREMRFMSADFPPTAGVIDLWNTGLKDGQIAFRKIEFKELPPEVLASDAKADLKRLQGKWEVSTVEQDGIKVAPNESNRWNVQGGEYILRIGNQLQEGKVRLDPAKIPAAIDLTVTHGPDLGKTYRGIYKFEVDDLWHVFPKNTESERPTVFSGNSGNGQILTVLKRALEPAPAPKQKEPAAEAGWTRLLNGKDLAGWVPLARKKEFDPKEVFHVNGNVLMVEGRKEHSLLRTAKVYENFELEFEFRVPPLQKQTAGCLLLLHLQPDNILGYMLSIDPKGNGFLIGPHRKDFEFKIQGKPPRDGGWSRVQLSCRGHEIGIRLNGEDLGIAKCKDGEFRKGFIAILPELNEVHYRNLRLHELPAPVEPGWRQP